MIPRKVIDDIRDRLSIVEIVSAYVSLKKRGINYIGLCPFHSEKTPSFTVNEEKKIFYCFGCNETGNVFNLLMKLEKLSFPEAATSLAARAGIDLSKYRGCGEKNIVGASRDVLYSLNRIVMEYFQSNLSGAAGNRAKKYLRERGLSAECTANFKIGYALSSWDGLSRHIERDGLSTANALKLGLICGKDRDKRKSYDRFRDRIIFPIFDSNSRVVAFGGRILADGEPKYLNSPESVLFKKGETLYGIDKARKAISAKGFVLLVEGYFDLITMHMNHFENTLATMGTALTSKHIRKLKYYTREIRILFDGDAAGRRAASKVLALLFDEDISAKAVFLPPAMDPDDFIKKKGKEAMMEAVDKAVPLMEFFLAELGNKFDLSTAFGKSEYMKEAGSALSRLSDPVERGHYADMVATSIGVGINVVYNALKNSGGKNRRRQKDQVINESFFSSSLYRVELKIIKLMLHHPELYHERLDSLIDSFVDSDIRESGAYIISVLKKGGKIDLSALEDTSPGNQARELLMRLSIEGNEEFDNSPERILNDCCKKIEQRGHPGEGTSRLLAELEQAGRFEDAELLKKGAKRFLEKKHRW